MALWETADGPARPDPEPSTKGWVGPDPGVPTASAPGKSTPAPNQSAHSTDRDKTDHLGQDEPNVDPSPELPTVPGYRVLEVVGRGGMGTVYRAVHAEMDREVALKLINPGGRDRHAVRIRYEREIRALAGIEHPNIIPIYDAGYVHGFPYYTMRFVPGGTLGHHLDRVRADLPAACRLVAKVARAVHRLHAAGVVHRDLKPHNILLDDGDEPLVADFGLARWIDDDSDLTASGFPVGTRPYMSPEQSLGSKEYYSAACDIWALGVILYEVLAGRRPFENPDPVSLYLQIRGQPPPPLSDANPAVTPALEAVVCKCLAKRPGHRYPTAEAVAVELERWAAGETVSVNPAEAAAVAASPRPRRKRLAVRALGFALVLCGVAAAGSVPRTDRPVTTAPLTPIGFRTIADRLKAGETVTLIGATGMPVVKAEPIPEFDSNLSTQNGLCLLHSPVFGAVELVRETLPGKARLEAEVQIVGNLQANSYAGVYIGRQETLDTGRLFQTMAVFGQYLIRPTDPNREKDKVVIKPQPGVPVFSPAAPAAQELSEIVIKPQPLLLWNHSPIYYPTRSLSRSTTEVKERPSAQSRWHKWEVVITPHLLSPNWDGHALPSITTDEFVEARTRVLSLENGKSLFPEVRYCEPVFGPGIGLYVRNADAVFRNVRLVPAP
jgi:hypothetical protein